IFGTAGALASGLEAARAALRALGLRAPRIAPPAAEDAPVSITPFWQVTGLPGRAFLDLQNDVTTKDIALAAQESFRAVEHMKRYTTQGMAPDQGKTSNVTALAVLADITGRAIPEVGTTTYRPPYVPVPIGAMGAGGAGMGFAPRRRAPAEAAHRDRAAPMLEAGLWYRPAYYPRPGETGWRPACDREVRLVREAVGVADVSTLGKIALQGPDAAALLDHVYANTLSTLAPGRVRYGLMLRPDGHVMDDGTVACLAPGSYLLTTTTHAAAQVMRHLEFVLQCLRPDLDAHAVSVTDQWAQFAVTGPRARRLMASLVAEDLGDRALPHMRWCPATIAGIQGRLFRVSFSGEVGFEIAIPARHGDALFRLLVAQAEALGGGAYGLEAMNVLRIEKGFLTHAEMDGRTTAFDLGLERMLSKDKDFIGRLAASRQGLTGPERAQLVGLRPAGAVQELLGGASLFDEGAQPVAANLQGHVTSAGYSPTLGHTIALGLLTNGRARIGTRVRMVDHMRKVETLCEVCQPCFFDPEGGRARG
ncbi:MAG: sarcosine oxidase subunit alpha, partial [Rhodobacteraceae bacterium]|nr:sarcosine oxidase subunit alpha [Paracoccaceae bacterium]